MTTELTGIKVPFGNLFQETKKKFAPVKIKKGVFSLPWNKLVPWEKQPRQHFDENRLNELAESIKTTGIIQPILVRKNTQINEEQYEIIAGERRWRAAQMAGLDEVPVVVRELSDDEALGIALIENIQREDLNPIEQAVAMSRLAESFSLSHQQIAEKVGRSRSVVTTFINLLSLPSEIINFLKEGRLDVGHAKALSSLEDEEIIFYALKVVENDLTVRQTEELVQKIKTNLIKGIDRKDENNWLEVSLCNKSLDEWTKNLSDKFFSSVHIKLNKKGEGRVTFQVDSVKDLEWLVQTLSHD